jgi:Outer membrane lipoprotein carrier protein LolA
MRGMGRLRVGRRALLVAASACLVAKRVSAADPVDALLARIASARATLHTLRGPFVQTRTIGLLATDVRSTGTLTLVRPDRLRWELAPPDAVTFWIGPEGLAYRDAHGQARLPATTARMAAVLDDLRTLLGGDPTRLRERWELKVTRDDATGAEMDATPRTSAGALLQHLRFALAPDLVRPVGATLTEGPHDRTVIEFGALVVDGPVDAESMKPPRG